MKPINPVMILLTTAILVASCGLNEKEKASLLPGDRESQIHNQELYIQTLLIQQDSIQTAIRGSMDRASQIRTDLVSLK
jgi:hypothetical protein